MSDYNNDHWQKQITKYQQQEWSTRPSPFAQLVETFITENATLLELGCGAGQDGIWFETIGYNVTMSDGHDVAFEDIRHKSLHKKLPVLFDISGTFPFGDATFDVVYAQLVLHYFDDATMRKILDEIKRVLKKGGLLACMVNSVHDPEYDPTVVKQTNLLNVRGLIKRYFTKETFGVFVDDFDPLLFDEKGRTPKDDAVGTDGMVQFIGRLK